MSEKQIQNAPSAEEQKPGPSKEPEKFVLFEKPKLSKKQEVALQTLGMDLTSFFNGFDRINEFANLVMARLEAHEAVFKQIETTLPDTIKKKMTESIEEARSKQIQAVQVSGTSNVSSNPVPSGVGLGDMMSFAKDMGLIGGSNPINEKVNTLFSVWLDRQMENLNKGSAADAFSKAFEEEFVKAKAKAAAKVLSE